MSSKIAHQNIFSHVAVFAVPLFPANVILGPFFFFPPQSISVTNASLQGADPVRGRGCSFQRPVHAVGNFCRKYAKAFTS